MAQLRLAQARFAPGESVLVRGAAGSIGIMTAQLGGAWRCQRGSGHYVVGLNAVTDCASSARPTCWTAPGEGGQDAPPGYDVIIDIAAGA